MITDIKLKVTHHVDKSGMCCVTLHDGGKRALLSIGFKTHTDDPHGSIELSQYRSTLRTRDVSALIAALAQYGILHCATNIRKLYLTPGSRASHFMIIGTVQSDDIGATCIHSICVVCQTSGEQYIRRDEALNNIKEAYRISCVDISISADTKAFWS